MGRKPEKVKGPEPLPGESPFDAFKRLAGKLVKVKKGQIRQDKEKKA